jgi:hypothetical protein
MVGTVLYHPSLCRAGETKAAMAPNRMRLSQDTEAPFPQALEALQHFVVRAARHS